MLKMQCNYFLVFYLSICMSDILYSELQYRVQSGVLGAQLGSHGHAFDSVIVSLNSCTASFSININIVTCKLLRINWS